MTHFERPDQHTATENFHVLTHFADAHPTSFGAKYRPALTRPEHFAAVHVPAVHFLLSRHLQFRRN